VSLRDRKVLVTGADGFIGSHLVERLVRDGARVRAFVFYNSFDSWGWLDHAAPAVREAIEVVAGDVRDPHGVAAAVEGREVVFHLAALIGIPYSYHSPDAYVDTNVKGTLNVLQAARRHGTARVIHTSTSEVYGTARKVPIAETHPLNAQSPYAATKTAADQLALSFHRSFGTPVAVMRPFNTYGPRQSTRAVLPTIITQIAAGAKTVKLGALHPTRDFNFVEDTVEGFLALAAAERALGEVVNFGSDFEISIGDAAKLVAEVMGAEVDIVSESARLRPDASEVERLWADNTRARELAGWRPRFAGREGLRRGLEQTVRWFREPANLARYKTGRYSL
jgi:NAD dependent epimerase/dehydratase